MSAARGRRRGRRENQEQAIELVMRRCARFPRDKNKNSVGRNTELIQPPTMAEVNNQPSEQQNAGHAEPEQLRQNGTIGTKPSKATVVSLNC